MKNLLLLLLLALPCYGQMLQGIVGASSTASLGTIALVQRVYDRDAFANNYTCTGATPNVCTLTVASTGTGNAMTIQTFTSNNGPTIASVSGGCGGAGWVVQAAAHTADSTNGTTNGATCAASTSGTTSIVVTMSAATSLNYIFFHEFSITTGSIAFDVAASAANVASSASQNGPDLTLTGTKDAIVQACFGNGQDCTAASSPYNTNFLNTNSAAQSLVHEAGSYAINQASGTHTTWTMAAADTHVVVSAIAMKAQ